MMKLSHRYRAIRREAGWGCIRGLLVLPLFLTSCTLGQATPTAVPFAVTPYATEAIAASTSLADESPAETSPDSASTDSASTSSASTSSASADEAASADTQVAAPPTASVESNTLRYNGEIAAQHQVVIVAETAGMVLSLPLEVGDRITEGQMIAQLDTTLLEAQKAQAMAGLAAAQAQLDLVRVAADPDDIAAAEAAVAAAGAAYQRAIGGATAEEQRLALAQLKMAEAAVTVAQAGYNQVKGNPAIGALPQSLQLQQATLGLEAAQAQYDKVLIGATQDVISGAYAQLAQARAALQRLKEGAKDEQIRAVEAQVKQAEMALYLAQLQLSKATVKAPVDGIVSRVNSAEGAMAAPGAPLVTLQSSAVNITIDVEEARLAQIQIGQPATIRVDAYPDQLVQGEVALIAPELDAATRTVQVTIRPTEATDLLAPGMFATVELVIGQ